MNQPSEKMITYILRNRENFYVGKTECLKEMIKIHKNDHLKDFKLIWSINGDYLINIEQFRISKFYNCIIMGFLK